MKRVEILKGLSEEDKCRIIQEDVEAEVMEMAEAGMLEHFTTLQQDEEENWMELKLVRINLIRTFT